MLAQELLNANRRFAQLSQRSEDPFRIPDNLGLGLAAMNNSTVCISENVLAVGDSTFVKQVVLPVAEKISELATSYPETAGDSSGITKVSSRPRASLTALGGLVGVFTFVSGWVATKVLDELFDLKLRPLLLESLGAIFDGKKNGKKYGLSIAVHDRVTRVTILIAAVGKSVEELEVSEALVTSTLAMATINAEKAKKPEVHLYVIDNGRCNVAPNVQPDMSAALEGLRKMLPARMPRAVRSGR